MKANMLYKYFRSQQEKDFPQSENTAWTASEGRLHAFQIFLQWATSCSSPNSWRLCMLSKQAIIGGCEPCEGHFTPQLQQCLPVIWGTETLQSHSPLTCKPQILGPHALVSILQLSCTRANGLVVQWRLLSTQQCFSCSSCGQSWRPAICPCSSSACDVMERRSAPVSLDAFRDWEHTSLPVSNCSLFLWKGESLMFSQRFKISVLVLPSFSFYSPDILILGTFPSPKSPFLSLVHVPLLASRHTHACRKY